MSTVTKFVLWFVLAAISVLVIKNASGFSKAVNSVGTQGNTLFQTLSGSGYKGATG